MKMNYSKENIDYFIVDSPFVFLNMLSFRVLVTSDDVLHSWAVPAFGIKIDAVPGRLNQVHLLQNVMVYSMANVSELCGVNHGLCLLK
jgi:hypothetical protein